MWKFRKTIRATDFWSWLFWRSGRWDGVLGFWFWSLLHNLPRNLLIICSFRLVFSLRPISHAYPRRKCWPWPRKSEVQTSLRERGGGDHWGGSPCSAPLEFTTCAVHSPYVSPENSLPTLRALRALATSFFLRAGHEGTCFLLSNQTPK